VGTSGLTDRRVLDATAVYDRYSDASPSCSDRPGALTLGATATALALLGIALEVGARRRRLAQSTPPGRPEPPDWDA
jgi:hypothetical protein